MSKLHILTPGSLLDDQPSSELSLAETTALAAVETAWQDVGRLVGLIKDYARAGTAAKALCGLRLRALQEHYFGPPNPQGGRPRKIANDSGFSSWASLLADKVGITCQTASVWMRLAKAVEAIASSEKLDLRTVCEKLPWDWSEQETALIEDTFAQLCEDKTQRQLLQSDFLANLGYEAPEKINSSNNPHGHNGSRKLAANPQELLAERQAAARIVFLGTEVRGRVAKGSVAMFMENFIATAGSDLEPLSQAELRDLYEHTVKPFAAAFRKLASL